MLRQQHKNTPSSAPAFLPLVQHAAAAAAIPQSESYDVTVFNKYKQEAQRNADPHAYYRLGLCFAQGYGVGQDEKKAVECYKNALLSFENEKTEDEKKIFAAMDASYQLGICHAEGYGTKQDEAKAIEYYLRNQNLVAQYRYRIKRDSVTLNRLELASYYTDGKEKNEEKAKHYHHDGTYDSGLDGNPYVLVRRAFFSAYYGNTEHGTTLSLLNNAVFSNDIQASYILGRCSMFGIHGIERNPFKAFRLYQHASQQGLSQAKLALGLCYYHGYGTIEDMQKAVSLFKQAADQNNAEAKIFLSADAKALLQSNNPHTAYQVIQNTKADNVKDITHRQRRKILEKMVLTDTTLRVDRLPLPFFHNYYYLLMNALQMNHSLLELDFGYCFLEEDMLFSLAKALSKSESLRVLFLLTEENISKRSLISLATAIAEPSCKLDTLILGIDPYAPFSEEDRLTDSDQILNCLLKTRLRTLEVRDLGCKTIYPDTIKTLQQNTTLTDLTLNHRHLSSSNSGAEAIEAVSVLVHSLCGHDRKLEKLQLRKDDWVLLESPNEVIDFRPFSLSTFIFLLQNPNLIHLDLTNALAHIGKKAAYLLLASNSLSQNNTLISLNLSGCCLSHDDSNLAAKAISSTSLERLVFKRNRVNVETIILLFQSQLRELILGLDYEGAHRDEKSENNDRHSELGDALSRNRTLTSLDFFCHLDLNSTMEKALLTNKTLQKLCYCNGASPLMLNSLVSKMAILTCSMSYCFSSLEEINLFVNHIDKNKNLISLTNNGHCIPTYFKPTFPLEEKQLKEKADFITSIIERNRSHLSAWQQFALLLLSAQAIPHPVFSESIILLFSMISQFMNEYPAEKVLSYSDGTTSQSRFFKAQLFEAKKRREQNEAGESKESKNGRSDAARQNKQGFGIVL